MKIGQKVVRWPNFTDRTDGGEAVRGQVVYIHPKGRYHVVEFEFSGGKVRQSFAGVSD